MADPPQLESLLIDVLHPHPYERALNFKVAPDTSMGRVVKILRKKGWGEVTLVYDGKAVEDTDTPARLNLQEGSLLQAVLPSYQSTPDGQPPEYVTVKFDRWDDDSACVQLRMHPQHRLGDTLIGMLNRWRPELPAYAAICYSYKGYYIDLDDTPVSLNLPSGGQINIHLFGYAHFGDRNVFQKRIDDGSYLDCEWNGRPMVTIRVERWDSQGFLKFRMDITEPFIGVARAVNAIWGSEAPPGRCVGLKTPRGCMFTLNDTPDSLGLKDGAVMTTWLQYKVKTKYQGGIGFFLKGYAILLGSKGRSNDVLMPGKDGEEHIIREDWIAYVAYIG